MADKEAQFVSVEFDDIRDEVREHLAALGSPIDSFLEEHILESKHLRIMMGGEAAGFASIHKDSLITQFHLKGEYQRRGQSAFRELRKREQVQAAFAPTCDEFFLSHALDDYRQLAKQAYFFRVGRPAAEGEAPEAFSLRMGEAADVAFIRERTGDFFEPVEKYSAARQLRLALSGGECVGIGIRADSALYDHTASIGMFVLEKFRQKGFGTAIIQSLIQECERDGVRVVAGCWYYNHRSKKTLEKAGMVTQTRLLKVDY